ncbi:MAG: hypothetical protein AABY32_02185 [Nanoarchaeota archaeon]
MFEEHNLEKKKHGNRINFLIKKKKKAKEIYKDWPKFYKAANNLKICSCSMCGNFRKNRKGKDKFTIQEIKQIEKEKIED